MIKDKTYLVPCLSELNTDNISEPFTVSVPGSKSITNRALLLATLAAGKSILDGVLFSDDSRHFLKCIQELGFETEVDEINKTVTVNGLGGKIPKENANIYVGSAGTAARFLAAYLGVSNGTYHLDSSEQMKKRPMAALLDSLRQLGCEIEFDENYNFFPFTLKSSGFGTDNISVNIDHSSQFLSALLISSSLSNKDLTINIEGNHGLAYIKITTDMMAQFGINADAIYDSSSKLVGYSIKANQKYNALHYAIEPDVSAACYFYAMAPLLRIPIVVNGVKKDSMQGDMQFIKIMEEIGCTSKETEKGILLLPPTTDGFPGVDVDMSGCSDQAITLAAIAPFATSQTTIRGIGHIKYQECNRMNAIVTELKKMGIECFCDEDSITINPGIPNPCAVDTYDDHRMAMGFSLIGLRVPGITIDNPSCCRKTFEDYFETLEALILAVLKQ